MLSQILFATNPGTPSKLSLTKASKFPNKHLTAISSRLPAPVSSLLLSRRGDRPIDLFIKSFICFDREVGPERMVSFQERPESGSWWLRDGMVWILEEWCVDMVV